MRACVADLNQPAQPDMLQHRERLSLALELGYTHVAVAHVADAATLADADVRACGCAQHTRHA
jgi:hypothetical protein